MIELNSKTQQDFLNREWAQRLLDAGVDMSDAKYCILHAISEDGDFELDFIRDIDEIFRDDILEDSNSALYKEGYYICGYYCKNPMPTYTVSELLYKLHEWIYPTINGKEFAGGLRFVKDAPFYIFYYALKTKNYDDTKPSDQQPEEWDESFMGEFEYPIESLASLLIQCHKKDIGIKDNNGNQISDTGNISDK